MAKISFPLKGVKREKNDNVSGDVDIFKSTTTVLVEEKVAEQKVIKEDDKLFTPQIPPLPPLHQEEDKPWLQVGLLVKINNKEVGNGRYNNFTALIKDCLHPPTTESIPGKELEKSTKEYSTCALVLLLRNDQFNGDILQADQKDLLPLPPAPNTTHMRILNTHHKHGGETVRIITTSGDNVEVELRNGHRLLLPTGMMSQFIE